MVNKNDHIVVPPTVLQVIEKFVTAMRADPAIADDSIDRLKNLLLKGTVPKPEEINAALFEALQDRQS